VIKTSATTLTEAAAQRLNAEAGAGIYACLSVSDTGTGIPPEVLPRIFEPFFTTKEVGKGTGLGLASVFGIMKQHHGGIEVNNRPGKGATFSVYFPALAAPVAKAVSAAEKAPVRGGTETLLLVEDEPTMRKLTRRLIERQGYRVLEAANGPEALEVWQKHREAVALLLTDLVMPAGLSGLELASRLLTEKPGLKVIFMSGYSQEAVQGGPELLASQSFIQKPFAPGQLLKTLRTSLDKAA